jgi:signal transduction histidine kinase
LTQIVPENRSSGAVARGPRETSEGADARLAAYARDLGRIYPGLAHDLRSFLNTMVLNLELLQRTAVDSGQAAEAAAKVRRYAAQIAEEVSGLEHLLKAAVGQMQLANAPERFDFRSLCEDLATVIDSYARQRRIRVQTTLADVPMMASGDRSAIRHAMTALLIAAVDSLPEGARLSISLRGDRRTATFTATADSPEDARVSVPASVPWIDPTSVAVAIARPVLERHDARLSITSEPLEPARLEIELNLAPLGA